MSNMVVYLFGALLITAALTYGGHLLGLGTQWLIIIALLSMGIGITGAVRKTRRPESSPAEE